MKRLFLIITSILFAWPAYAADYYVTPSGAGTNSGAAWANAMALSDWQTHIGASASAGDNYYLAGGTYTLSSNLTTALDGTATSPISVIGVTSGTTNEPPLHSDWAAGTDRPLLAASSYTANFDDYWHFLNLRVTTTSIYGLRGDVDVYMENIESYNSSGTAGRRALYCGSNRGRFINCDVRSDNGIAIDADSTGLTVLFSYIHNSATGIGAESSSVIAHNIIADCTTGIDLVAEFGVSIFNNTIDDGTTGITATTASRVIVYNNIISNFTTGASWTTEQSSNVFDFNNWYGNTSDTSNATKGGNALALNPSYTDAANEDYSIGTNLKDAALPKTFPGSATISYSDIGAVQREEPVGGGGGGGTVGYFSMD